MSDSLVPFDKSILALLRASFGEDGLALPFVQEIFLMECHVAGTSYLDLEEVEESLSPTDLLLFKREPDNPYDELAILIFDQTGNKLGYVPRAKNEVIARLMDAGKLLFGKLESKNWFDEWLKMDIRVYMRDY
ncbi:MAG: HIRAN domain-containing protein [Armatimonadetes bacterium]|nr:HIRAN domain-containing protein [Armatimonadota bacterium]